MISIRDTLAAWHEGHITKLEAMEALGIEDGHEIHAMAEAYARGIVNQRSVPNAVPYRGEPLDASEDVSVMIGSGNVFADLGLPWPGIHLVKANVALRVKRILDTAAPAAEASIPSLTPDDVSDICRGRVDRLSVRQLEEALAFLRGVPAPTVHRR